MIVAGGNELLIKERHSGKGAFQRGDVNLAVTSVTVTVRARDHNRGAALFLLHALLPLTRFMPASAEMRLVKLVLRLYWVECKIGQGQWKRVPITWNFSENPAG